MSGLPRMGLVKSILQREKKRRRPCKQWIGRLRDRQSWMGEEGCSRWGLSRGSKARSCEYLNRDRQTYDMMKDILYYLPMVFMFILRTTFNAAVPFPIRPCHSSLVLYLAGYLAKSQIQIRSLLFLKNSRSIAVIEYLPYPTLPSPHLTSPN